MADNTESQVPAELEEIRAKLDEALKAAEEAKAVAEEATAKAQAAEEQRAIAEEQTKSLKKAICADVLKAGIEEGRITPAMVEQTEKAVLWGVNNVQLSLDISFDIWITAGAFFLAAGLAMKRGRRWLGVIGLLVAAFTLGMNIWKYPDPPAEVGGIDGGPYLATWFGFYLWLETRQPRS